MQTGACGPYKALDESLAEVDPAEDTVSQQLEVIMTILNFGLILYLNQLNIINPDILNHQNLSFDTKIMS